MLFDLAGTRYYFMHVLFLVTQLRVRSLGLKISIVLSFISFQRWYLFSSLSVMYEMIFLGALSVPCCLICDIFENQKRNVLLKVAAVTLFLYGCFLGGLTFAPEELTNFS